MGAPCLLDPTHRNRVHWLSHLPGCSRISLAAPNQMSVCSCVCAAHCLLHGSPGEKAMSFLNNKSFHPGNIQNRFKLYEAEEKKKVEDRRKEELRREFERKAQRRQTKSYLTGGDAAANGGLGFMYQRPAGYIDAAEKQQRASTQEKTPAERDVE